MGTFHAELVLPNDVEGLELARHFVTDLVGMARLGDDDGPVVVDATVEACANVIDHAYEPGEDATFRVVGDVDAAGLHLRVHDTGLKYDASARLAPGRQRASEEGGLARIRAAFDTVEWVNRGRAGKELHLVKRRSAPLLDTGDLAVDPDDDEQVPLAPEQEYEVRLFRPEDALGVCRVIYRNYGNTYFHEACYFPERMVDLNETGELASVVAVAADGEVVGHYALERPGLTRVAERGMAVVSPAHRGRDLMTRMRTFIEEEAARLGLIGVWSVAVTKHTYSQRVNETFGSDVCGVMLAGGPESQQFRGLEEGRKRQRVSWVVYFTYVTPPERALVHAPARHRAIMERIYAGLDLPVEWHDEVRRPDGEGEIDVVYSRELENGTITVQQVGEDTVAEVRRATEDLFEVTGADVICLNLPLADPSTPALMDELEALGYFFCGIGPAFVEDGDALMLQCLAPHVELDRDAIEVASPFAAELVDYCLADRERVRGAG